MNPNDFPRLATYSRVASFPQVTTYQVPLVKFDKLVEYPTIYGNKIVRTPEKYKTSTAHVRDLGDILFGNPITGTEQLKRTLRDNGLDGLVYVPLLNRIAGAAVMFKERTVEPIMQGKPKEAFVNMLESVGYTADTLSNIVKSFLPVAGGGTWDDFLDSMGWREGFDRKQYQADTGNLITDILVEALADPTTWLSLGGKAAISASKETVIDATKEALETTLKKELAKEMSEELAESMAKTQIRLLNDKTIENLAKALVENVGMEDSKVLEQIQDMLKANNTHFTKELLKNVNKTSKLYPELKNMIKSNQTMSNLLGQPDIQKAIMNLRFSDGYKWFRTGSKLLSISNKVDKALLLAGLQLSTAGPSLFYLNKNLGISKNIVALWNNRINLLKKVNPQDVLKDKKGTIKRVNKYITDLYNTYYEGHEQLINHTAKQADYIYKKAVNSYMDLLSNIKVTDASIDIIDKRFYNTLVKRFPSLKIVDVNELNEFLQPAKREALEKWHTIQYISTLEKDLKGAKLRNVRTKDWAKKTVAALEQYYLDNFGGNGSELVDALRNYDKLGTNKKEFIDKLLEATGLGFIKDKKQIADAIAAFNRGDDAKLQLKFERMFKKNIIGDLYDAVSVPKYVDDLYSEITKQFDKVGEAYKKGNLELKEVLEDVDHPLHKLFGASTDKAYKEKVTAVIDQITEFEKQSEDYKELGLDILDIFDANKIQDINEWAERLDNAFQIDAYADLDSSLKDLLSDLEILIDEGVETKDQADWLVQSIDTLHNRVNGYIRQFENTEELRQELVRLNDITVSDIQILKELRDLLKRPDTMRIVTNAKELVKSYNNYYQLVMSSYGRIRVMNRELMDTDLFKLLSTDSREAMKLRNDLVSTIVKMHELNTEDSIFYANELAEVFGAIDSTLNMNRLLQTDIEFIPIPEDVKDFVTGMIVNGLTNKNYADLYIEHMLLKQDELIDSIMEQINIHTSDMMLEYFASGQFDRIHLRKAESLTIDLEKINQRASDLADEIEAIKMHNSTEAVKISHKEQDKELANLMKRKADLEDQLSRMHLNSFVNDSPNPEIMLANWQTELQEVLKQAFKEYIDTMLYLENDLQINLKFYNAFNDRLVHMMTDIGDNIININGVILKLDLNTADSVNTFANLISHKVIGNIDNFNKLTDTERVFLMQKLGFENMDQVAKYIVDQCNVPLGTAVTNAFKEIDRINSQLSYMSPNYISRTAGSYYSQLNQSTVKAKNVIAFATIQDFNDLIRKETTWSNAYSWSTANGYLAVKRLDNSTMPKSLNLQWLKYNYLDADVASDLTLLTFVNKYNDAYKYAEQFSITSENAIKIYRQLLIKFYSENDYLFGPIDPTWLFGHMDNTNILAWYNTTLDSTFNKDCATKFAQYVNAFKESHDVNKGIMQDIERQAVTYMSLTEKLNQPGIWEEDILNEIIETAPSNTGSWVVDAMERKLKEYMKDPESLAQHQAEFTKYIQNNVKQTKELRALVNMSNEQKTLREMLNISPDLTFNQFKKEYYDLYTFLKGNRLNLDDAIGSASVQRFLKHERAAAFADNIKRMSAKQLRTYVDKNTQGFMIYMSDTSDKLFDFSKDVLDDAGLIIEEIPNMPNSYFIRRTTLDMTNNEYTWRIPKWNFPSLQKQVTQAFKGTSSSFYWDTMYIPDQLFTGEMMDTSLYDALFIDRNLAKLIGNSEVQKTYLKTDAKGINSFFTKDVSRPNGVIVGSEQAYNRVVDYLRGNNTNLGNLMYKSTRLDKSAHIGITQALLRQDAEQKYLQMFFNDDFSITGKFWNKIISNATDTELGSLFARNKNVAVILRENAKGLPQVYKVAVTGRTSLDTLKKVGAIIVPHEIYRNMVLTVNEHKVSNRLMQLYRRFFVQTFKTIYLSNPGFLFRNGVDSFVYKNAATTDGVWSILDNFKYEHRAAKLLELHNNVTKTAIDIAQGRTLNKKTIAAALRKYTPQEQAQYRLVELFLNSHASGGYTKALREYLLEYNMKDLVFDGTKFEEFWVNDIINNPYSVFIQDINSQIEQTARLGLFLNLVDNGGSVTNSIAKVVDTHFDYDLFANRFNLLEEVFWFSTFPLNNIAYYINNGLLKNPELLKLHLDITEQSWNSGDYTWDKVRSSNYLTYNAMAGNIRLYMLGNDAEDPTARVVLKTGSSAYDFFQTMFLPITSAKERLNPILAVLLGTASAEEELDPTRTVRNRIKQVLQGNPVPSVIATLYPNRTYSRNRTSYNKRSNWTSYPKRIRKPSSRSQHSYRLATNRYYFGKHIPKHYKVTAPYVTSIAPYWYNGRSTQARRQLYRIRHKKSELYR